MTIKSGDVSEILGVHSMEKIIFVQRFQAIYGGKSKYWGTCPSRDRRP